MADGHLRQFYTRSLGSHDSELCQPFDPKPVSANVSTNSGLYGATGTVTGGGEDWSKLACGDNTMATIYQRSKGGPYWGSYYLSGKRFRFSTNTRNRRDAQAEADRREAEAIENQKFDGTITLLTAASRFFVHKANLKPRTLENYRMSAVRLVEFMGDVSLNKIHPVDLSSFMVHRVNEGARIAGKRDLAFLSSLYALAKTWPDGPENSPFNKFEMKNLPEAEQRTVWLTDTQIEALLKVCKQAYQRLFIILSVDTGMRKMETLTLRWSDIDMNDRLIVLGNIDRLRTKAGRGRVIPLTNRVYDTLRDTPRESQWVFPGSDPKQHITTVKTFWKRVTKDANLEGVRVHDLRHTFGTRAQQAGMDPYTMRKIMGHANIQSSQRYIHPSMEALQNAMNKLNQS